MKLLIDDKTGRVHCLNANETCIYAAILKCTKAGRGWFANYRDLADALPFVISRMTVTRAVEKLLKLGLIERRENALFANAQNEQIGAQNEHENAQNEQADAQNEQKSTPPITPYINNEIMNEKNATCTHACDTHTPELPSFSDLCNTFRQKGGKINNYEGGEAYDVWSKASNAKKVKLFRALERGDFFKQRLDWLISDFPEPEPTNYNGTARGGEMLASGEAKVANYKGRFGIFTLEDIALFNIPLSD